MTFAIRLTENAHLLASGINARYDIFGDDVLSISRTRIGEESLAWCVNAPMVIDQSRSRYESVDNNSKSHVRP